MPRISHTWGTNESERNLSYPCDAMMPEANGLCFRGVTIQATSETIFRWLCQMRVAPYSYDWIDNLGRQSPQKLTPGLDKLALGQDFMQIFELIDFEKDKQVTLRMKPQTLASKVFGDLLVTYLIQQKGPSPCRLLVKIIGSHPKGPWGTLMKHLLPWGDLIMMRRQLLNFKRLSEG